MEMMKDQMEAETRRIIALYVGSIGMLLFGTVFLVIEAFLIQMDNTKKAREKQEMRRNESRMFKERLQQQKAVEEVSKPRFQSGAEDADDEDTDPETPVQSEEAIIHFSSGRVFPSADFTTPLIHGIVESTIPAGSSESTNCCVIEMHPVCEDVEDVTILEPAPGFECNDPASDFRDMMAASLQPHINYIRPAPVLELMTETNQLSSVAVPTSPKNIPPISTDQFTVLEIDKLSAYFGASPDMQGEERSKRDARRDSRKFEAARFARESIVCKDQQFSKTIWA